MGIAYSTNHRKLTDAKKKVNALKKKGYQARIIRGYFGWLAIRGKKEKNK
tara:strand:+ start:531 stop:680 length:150 start_codon:yes stop_codon:yes gene_type:complete